MTVTDYLSWCLAEECAEVQKAISKCERFGRDSVNPNNPTVRNIDELIDEIYDVRARARMLLQNLKVPYIDDSIDNYIGRKEKLEHNMEIAKRKGILHFKRRNIPKKV